MAGVAGDETNDVALNTHSVSASVPSVEWGPMPEPVVFRNVRLRWRLAQGEPEFVDPNGVPPRHGPSRRTLCAVRLQAREPEQFTECEAGGCHLNGEVLQFRVGDTFGFKLCAARRPWLGDASSWKPIAEVTNRVEVPRWLTEVVLASQLGMTVEVESMSHDSSTAKSVEDDLGPRASCVVSLLASVDTHDVLGDGGVILRVLEPGPGGVKAKDLARVQASWRVWFARNAELLMTSSSFGKNTTGEIGLCRDSSSPFTIDQGKLMIALELGIKEMACGSHAVLRVSETWGEGSLTPEGNPHLSGAAIWAEIKIHDVQNELEPGEHTTVDEALHFALEKKEEGNSCFAKGTKGEMARAVRRYQRGIQMLQATLPGYTPKSKTSPQVQSHACALVVAEGEQLEQVLTALTTLELNCAQAELKLGYWQKAIILCDVVIQRSPDNIKARYRRGLARAELGDLQAAIEDLRCVAVANPKDSVVRKELLSIEARLREQRVAEKKTFGGVFEKMQREDKEKCRQEEERARAEEEKRQKEKEAQEEHHKKMLEQCEAAKAAEGARSFAETLKGAQVENAQPEAPSLNPTPLGPVPEDKPYVMQEDVGKGTELDNLEGMKVGKKDRELIEKIKAGMVQPMMSNVRTVEATEPVEYEVPSFLKKKTRK